MDLECVDMFFLMTVPPSVFYQSQLFLYCISFSGDYHHLSTTAWCLFRVASLLGLGRSIGVLHLLV